MSEARFDPEIGVDEHGRVRLWQIERGAEGAEALIDAARNDDGKALAEALGAEGVQGRWAEAVAVGDLQAIGLEGYLAEGYGVPDAQLEAARDRLRSAEGHVLIVPSSAFAGGAQRLDPGPALSPLAMFETEEAPGPLPPAPEAAGAAPSRPDRSEPDEPEPEAGGLMRPMLVLGAILLAGAAILAVTFAG